MSIIQIYKTLNFVWPFLILLQSLIIILSTKSDSISFHPLQSFLTKSSSETVKGNQPALYIMFFNSLVMLLYLITHFKYFVSIGIPPGGLLLYLSFAGDLSDIILNKEESEQTFLSALEFKQLIHISILSTIINFIASSDIIMDIKACSEWFALVEIVFVIMFLYLLLYYIGVSIYLILGHISWDPSNHIKAKIDSTKEEKRNLITNIGLFAINIDKKVESWSTIKKVITFFPLAFVFTLAILLNYIKQLARNILLLWLIILNMWIAKRKNSLCKHNLLPFLSAARHLSIISVLCTAYVYLSFTLGIDSIITKIVYGFSTIIIIPIAINRFSSINTKSQ